MSQVESSDARKTAMDAISLGWPMRPSGVCAMAAFSNSDPIQPPLWVPSVSTMPGLIVLTRIFFGPSSRAGTPVMASTAPLSARVNRAVRRCDAANNGAHVYDAAPLSEVLRSGLRRKEEAQHVDIEVPVKVLLGDSLDGGQLVHVGIVYEDVDWSSSTIEIRMGIAI